jgi:hypothetical protein
MSKPLQIWQNTNIRVTSNKTKYCKVPFKIHDKTKKKSWMRMPWPTRGCPANNITFVQWTVCCIHLANMDTATVLLAFKNSPDSLHAGLFFLPCTNFMLQPWYRPIPVETASNHKPQEGESELLWSKVAAGCEVRWRRCVVWHVGVPITVINNT